MPDGQKTTAPWIKAARELTAPPAPFRIAAPPQAQASSPALGESQQTSRELDAVAAWQRRADAQRAAVSPANIAQQNRQAATLEGDIAAAEGVARRQAQRAGPLDLTGFTDVDLIGALRASPEAFMELMGAIAQWADQNIPLNDPWLEQRYPNAGPRASPDDIRFMREGGVVMPEIVVQTGPQDPEYWRAVGAQRREDVARTAEGVNEGVRAYAREALQQNPELGIVGATGTRLSQDVLNFAEALWREPARRSENAAQLRDRLRAEAERLGDPQLAQMADRAALDALLPYVLDYPGIITAPEFAFPGTTARIVAATRNTARAAGEAGAALRNAIGEVGIRRAPVPIAVETEPLPLGEVPQPSAPAPEFDWSRLRRADSRYVTGYAEPKVVAGDVWDAFVSTGHYGDEARTRRAFEQLGYSGRQRGDGSIERWDESANWARTPRLMSGIDPTRGGSESAPVINQIIDYIRGKSPRNMASEVMEARRASQRRPQSLSQFVRAAGGVLDDRGDVGDVQDVARGFARLTNRTSGRTIDDLAQASWEAGFFPDLPEAPSANEFLGALRADATGLRRVVADLEGEAMADDAASLLAALDDVGMDPSLRGQRLATHLRNLALGPRSEIGVERPQVQGDRLFSGIPVGREDDGPGLINQLVARIMGRTNVAKEGDGVSGEAPDAGGARDGRVRDLGTGSDGSARYEFDAPDDNVASVAVLDDGSVHFSLRPSRYADGTMTDTRGQFTGAQARQILQGVNEVIARDAARFSRPSYRLMPQDPRMQTLARRVALPEGYAAEPHQWGATLRRVNNVSDGGAATDAPIPATQSAPPQPALVDRALDWVRRALPGGSESTLNAGVNINNATSRRIVELAEEAAVQGRRLSNEEIAAALNIKPGSARTFRSALRLGAGQNADRYRAAEEAIADATTLATGDSAVAARIAAAAGPDVTLEKLASIGGTTYSHASRIARRFALPHADRRTTPAHALRNATWLRDSEAGMTLRAIAKRDGVGYGMVQGGIRAALRAHAKGEPLPEPAPMQDEYAALASRLGISAERARAISAQRSKPSLPEPQDGRRTDLPTIVYHATTADVQGPLQGQGSLGEGAYASRSPEIAERLLAQSGEFPEGANIVPERVPSMSRYVPLDRMDEDLLRMATRRGVDPEDGQAIAGLYPELIAYYKRQGYVGIHDPDYAEGMGQIVTWSPTDRRAPWARMAADQINSSDPLSAGVNPSLFRGRKSESDNVSSTGQGQPIGGEAGTNTSQAAPVENVTLAIPADPAQWRDLVDAHPWINSPSRAQLIIMGTARQPHGGMRYTNADIANATGYSLSTVPRMLSTARAAGLPVPIRPQGAGRPVGGDVTHRLIDLVERVSRAGGDRMRGADMAQALGGTVTPNSVKVILSNVRRGLKGPELQRRLAEAESHLRAGYGDSASIAAEIMPWLATGGYFTALNAVTQQGLSQPEIRALEHYKPVAAGQERRT